MPLYQRHRAVIEMTTRQFIGFTLFITLMTWGIAHIAVHLDQIRTWLSLLMTSTSG